MPNLQIPMKHFAQGKRDLGRLSSDQSSTPVKRKPGRPPVPNPKQAVSLRLEPEVLEKFRATGAGWQRRMNDVLKAAKLDD
ncbi:BrnA antitoxin family protein [Tianweitania sp. BSSL-BM11]|uniref:BrnA antitoxin family protein n=1 Tax=Tianweitania aestuarii TaxID=2814886 RepID=A0ABS5RVM4_9HYPH|nr:BrnA antitoxin family protein [Tianweitania aestuarii]MBS9721113.1 BrnA antitoxin family protein [Tianweitania aestuarii]